MGSLTSSAEANKTLSCFTRLGRPYASYKLGGNLSVTARKLINPLLLLRIASHFRIWC